MTLDIDIRHGMLARLTVFPKERRTEDTLMALEAGIEVKRLK